MAGDADHLVIADDSVPVAVVVDPNGVVERVLTWPVRSDRREFEVASAVAIRGAEVWVGSPAAGGVVWFPSWEGDPVVIDLPIDVRILEPAAASGRIWVAGAPGGVKDSLVDVGVPMSRRVEWRDEPSRFDSDQQWIVVSAHGGVLGNLEAARAAGIDVDAIAARVAAGVEDEDDDEAAGWEDDGDEEDVAWENAPLLLWAIDGGVASLVDLVGGVRRSRGGRRASRRVAPASV